ncbi:MAG: hypothetical protein Kow00107_05510 [Planctomycetota bacterium]
MRAGRLKLSQDIPFISGVYAIFIISMAFLSWWVSRYFEEGTHFAVVLLDVIFLFSTLATVVAAAAVSRYNLLVSSATCFVVGLFIFDVYFQAGFDTQDAFRLLNSADFWSFLAIALLTLRAFFLENLQKQDYVALVGWAFFSLGHLLAFDGQMKTNTTMGFVPLSAALVFWVAALWLGSKRYFSR